MTTAVLIVTAIASTITLMFVIYCQHVTIRDMESRLAKKPLGRLSKADHTAIVQYVRDMRDYHTDQYTKIRMGFILTKLESIDG